MTRPHWHAHSTMPGYLCECDEHWPLLTAKERDDALRAERDEWREYQWQINDDPEARKYSHIVIRGSVQSGYFEIDDTKSHGWWRIVESWPCQEEECLTLLDDD